MAKNERPPVIEKAKEARQGRLGKPVLIVLVTALLLALLAWGGAEWWGQTIEPVSQEGTDGSGTAPAEQSDDPPTAASGNSAPTDQTPHAQTGTGGYIPSTNDTGSTNAPP